MKCNFVRPHLGLKTYLCISYNFCFSDWLESFFIPPDLVKKTNLPPIISVIWIQQIKTFSCICKWTANTRDHHSHWLESSLILFTLIWLKTNLPPIISVIWIQKIKTFSYICKWTKNTRDHHSHWLESYLISFALIWLKNIFIYRLLLLLFLLVGIKFRTPSFGSKTYLFTSPNFCYSDWLESFFVGPHLVKKQKYLL